MRSETDVLRSLIRYLWRTFEDDVPPVWNGTERSWEIRPWGTEGEFGFPFIRVAAITPVVYAGPASWREATQTYAIHAYPVPQDTPDNSIMEVARVKDLLFIAFEQGFSYVDQSNPLDPLTAVTVASAPRRIPLYDHDGVPLDGPNSVSYARHPNDYLRVLDCPINHIVDPEDDRYWLVTVEARVTWRRLGRVPKGDVILQRVAVTQTGS